MLTFTSFRGRLALWFTVLSMLTLLSVGLYVGRLATRQIAVTAGESVHAAALAAANLLGANLRERELEIALLAQEAHFASGDLSRPDILMSLELRKKSRSEFAWLGVADAQGTVVQASAGMLQGQSVGKRPWFAAGLQGVYAGDVHEALLLAKLLPGLASGEPLRFIDFAAPIRNRQGQVVGVLGAHGHWRWVTETVQAAATRLGGDHNFEILIVDKKGAVLYPQNLVGQSQWPTGLDTQSPYATVNWGDGRSYLTSAVAVNARTQNDLGWRIVVRQPLDVALEPLYAMRNRLLMLGLVATLVFALVAVRLARSVSQPIEELALAAQQIERRETAPRYPAASAVRERLSLEQWNVIVRAETEFFRQCAICTEDGDYSPVEAMRILEGINGYTAAMTGAQTDRMTRDDGWRLLSTGRHIERLGFLASALAQAFETGAVFDEGGFEAVVALFDSTITFHAQYQQRRDMPALLDLLVIDRDNPRSLAWVAQTLRGRIAKIEAAAGTPGESAAMGIPEASDLSLVALCTQDAEGRHAALEEYLGRCVRGVLGLSDVLATRYFTHSIDALRHSVGA